MVFKFAITLSILCISTVWAFQDSDIDGVADDIDSCPHTPFDVLVDARGCSSEESIHQKSSDDWGALTLKIGSTLRSDERYEDERYINFYANYRYHNWDVSFSNRQLTTKSSNVEDNSDSDNDIYLTLGYILALPKSMLKLSIGSKIVDNETVTSQNIESRMQGAGRFASSTSSGATSSLSNETRDNDYFASINYTYRWSATSDVFGYYGYTISGDGNEIDYEDYSSFSLGVGHAFTSSFYSALSYNYTGSIYENGEAEEGITWFNSYRINPMFFGTISYTYALDNYSYEHAVALGFGVYFQ